MKKLTALTALTLTSVLAGALLATAPAAHAASVTGQFDVTINLTAACEIASLPTAAFTYAGGQSTASTFTSTFNIRCTNGLAISSITLDQTSITDTATNLAYTLALSNVPTAGTGVAQTITGFGGEQDIEITGMARAGQPGTCGSGRCTASQPHTLTIRY